jgi:hypothetical protein
MSKTNHSWVKKLIKKETGLSLKYNLPALREIELDVIHEGRRKVKEYFNSGYYDSLLIYKNTNKTDERKKYI